MKPDRDSMFGNPLNILRALSFCLLILLIIAFMICYPVVALILVGLAVIGGIGLSIAFMVGEYLGWWDSIW